MKSRTIKQAQRLTDIPNVGKMVAEDLLLIGIKKPIDLKGKDALKLYKKMCLKTGIKIDYCMLDVLMAVVDFANGRDARKWWHYTQRRKLMLKNIK